jgi:hypothetical protein
MIENPTDVSESGGHEPIAIGTRAIVYGLATVMIAVAVGLLLMAGLKAFFTDSLVEEPAVASAIVPIVPPPGVPDLDADQPGDLRQLRQRERDMLTEYVWIDRNAGLARIPIQRAMEILAQAPATQFAPESTDENIVHP